MNILVTELQELSTNELKQIAKKFEIRYDHAIDKGLLISNIVNRYYDVKKYISYTYVRQLGREGKDGRAFLALDSDGNEVAIKIFKKKKSSLSIEREAKLQQIAADYGISPRVIEYNGDGKFIVMEKMELNLYDCFCDQKGKLTKYQQKSIIKLFQKLDDCKVFHGDPNPLNFMRKGNKWYIIDFGFAKPINSKTIAKYGNNPNMNYMPRGFKKKMEGVYNKCVLEHIEPYC